jgi:integrase
MQLQLDLTVSPTLEQLSLERSKLRLGCASQATQTGYAFDWKVFTTWCVAMERNPLPASTETLSLYITDLIAKGKKVSTVLRRMYGALHYNKEAGFERPEMEDLRSIITGAQRLHGDQPRQMSPLTVLHLAQIASVLSQEGTQQAIRDRAIMVLGFASALRRANISALLLEDIGLCDEGLTIRVRREKQDQQSKGRTIGLPRGKNLLTCPRTALDDWLRLRGRSAGPLFTRMDNRRSRTGLNGMSPDSIWRTVKRSVVKIGLDPANYGGHSLRSGFVTEAFQAEVGEIRIANHTGHRSLSCLRRYFRPCSPFKANACSAIGL